MKRTPMTQALLTGAILVVVGIVAIALGKRVVARTEDVYDQMPALVSGGVGGLALVIIGCVIAYVQVGRVLAQQERLDQAEVIGDVVTLTELKRNRLEAGRPLTSAAAQSVSETPGVPQPRRTTRSNRVRRVRSEA